MVNGVGYFGDNTAEIAAAIVAASVAVVAKAGDDEEGGENAEEDAWEESSKDGEYWPFIAVRCRVGAVGQCTGWCGWFRCLGGGRFG